MGFQMRMDFKCEKDQGTIWGFCFQYGRRDENKQFCVIYYILPLVYIVSCSSLYIEGHGAKRNPGAKRNSYIMPI